MYSPLYIKTEYSLLSSLIKIDDLILKCKTCNINSLAICDDNLFGTMEFIKKCNKNNIKPIIGLDIKYLSSNILLYAKNINGYHNLIKLEGINTPEQADLLRNAYLEVDREHAVPLEEGTYYIVDLIGLEVYTEEGKLLGKVDDIYNTGANDIYVIKDELGKQVLLPGIKDVIKNVDLEGGKITVHLIPGLI